jgi:hypothetical protein
LRWSVFKHKYADEMLLHVQMKVFPFLKTYNSLNHDSHDSKITRIKENGEGVNDNQGTHGELNGGHKSDRRKDEMITFPAITIPGNSRHKSTLEKYLYRVIPSLKNIYTFNTEIKHTLNNKPQIKISYAQHSQEPVVRIVFDYNQEINNQLQSTTSDVAVP